MKLSERLIDVKIGTTQEMTATDVPMSLNVVRSLEETPGTLDLTLFNLGVTTRNALTAFRPQNADLAKPPELIPIEIVVGYEGETKQRLFKGTIRTITHHRSKAQWKTRILAGDGDYAYGTAVVHTSGGQKRPIDEIIKEIADEMGVDRGNLDEALSSKPYRKQLDQYEHGYACAGLASREFSRLIRTLGYDWSIQDGQLQILRGNETIPPKAFPLTTPGLVETPSRGEQGAFVCRSLMNGTLQPGRRVHVIGSDEQQSIDERIRINRVVHWGSTFSDAWYSDVEGVRV